MSSTNLFRYLFSLCLVLIINCLLIHSSFGQEASNQRGFQPGNSFSIGDFETINTTNGNLMLRFPLGALPGGRNGLSTGINLIYNSKVLDSETQYELDENGSCHVVGDPGEGVLVCPYHQKTVLRASTEGGWRLGFGYSLKLIDRQLEFNSIPSELRPQCWNPQTGPGPTELQYRYKLMLVFPDGSSHEMRPNGWTDGNGNDQLHDYFDIRPDGYWYQCTQEQWYLNTITYYSIDGSHLRLDVQHDGNTAGGWWDNPWTLYLPDGSRVTTNQANSEPQRIYDRNNNYVEFVGNGVRDQFGRTLTMSTSTATGQRVDTFTTQGFGASYSWTVRWKTISGQKSYWPCRSLGDCSQQILLRDNYGFSQEVVDTITLPAQAGSLTYQFSYNAADSNGTLPVAYGWGELSGITLPSGAHVTYAYVQDGDHPDSYVTDILRNSPVSKVVTYNQEYDGATTPVTETWGFDISTSSSSITAPDGGVSGIAFVDTTVPVSTSGLTYFSVGPDGTKTETIWEQNNLDNTANINYHPKTVFTSIKNAAGAYVKTAIKDYKYDKNGNITRVAEYDWVNYADVPRDAQSWPTGIPSVSPVRVTVNTYYNSTPDSSQVAGNNTNVYWSSGSPRVKNAVASTEVRKVVSGVEQAVARTEFTYDNPSNPANLIQSRMWASAKGGYSNPLTSANSITTSAAYNQYGMPTLTTDARGTQTSITYGDLGGGVLDLYPTQIKTAYQTAVQRTETREYDFNTGLVTRVTDVDNNVAVSTTYDALGRPLLVRAAEGKPEEIRTSYEYADAQRRVITRSDLFALGDGKSVSIQHFDQLGRVRLARQLEDPSQSATDETTGIKVQTRYLYSGGNAYSLVSNAYRAATANAASAEATMGWTRSKRDNAGRVIELQTFGGAGLPAPWGSSTLSTGTLTTSFDGNFTTVTDQAGKVRRSVVDALGRLIRVDEPDGSGNLGSTASPAQPTSYSYDVFGNLLTVTQGTQIRSFSYDSLSRLQSANNPESGTILYQYDNVGNLIVKTDARGVSTHLEYDALNRLTRRWYNASSLASSTTHNNPALPSSVGGTDEVKFYYDSQALPSGAPSYTRGFTAGRLVAQTYGAGSNGDYFAYDVRGRTTLKYQQIGATNYLISAAYTLSGALTSLTYPSGRTIANSYDEIGRLTTFSGNLGDNTTRTYATGILYSPTGGLVKEQFGTATPVYNKLFYNSRGQLADIRVSTSYTGPTDTNWNRGAIINSYSDQCSGVCSGSGMTDNNGNLKRQEVYIPNDDQISAYTLRSQLYDYDSLNRLNSAREVLNGTEQWKQQFTYDRWGNRTINTGVTYGTGINNKAFTVDTSSNRLGVPSGQSGVMSYDAAGNLTNDTYTGAGNRTYDAENKIVSALGGNNQAQLYGYDANGQRIKHTVDGVETWQVYGFGGELLAEYPANGAAASPQTEYGYRNGQLLITADAGSSLPLANVALPANGGTVTASSTMVNPPLTYPVSSVNNGDRKGLNAGFGGSWLSSTATFPQWVQVDFNGSKSVSEIDVFSLQDNYGSPIEPTETTTFSLYGLTAFDVQYWNGTSWTTVPGGSVSGNNKVWKKISFAPLSTSKIRVLINGTVDGWSRMVEVEAWAAVPSANVALSASGATASASSTAVNPPFSYPVSATNNGDHKGLNAGTGGNWLSSTATFPQWVQVDFNGSKTIGEIDVLSLQDNYGSPIEPTETTTFSLYGLTAFDLQYWNGSSWTTVPGGSVTGNNKVWKKVTFTPLTTSKIRVLINGSVDGYSRVVELEAWTPAASNINWLVTDHLGTPRMIVDQTGSLANVKRHDYLPFGEELFAPTAGRSSAQGYSSDAIRQRFTSKERDIETGLDDFGARYYGQIQGRFLTADPLLSSGIPAEPKSWNRYIYCLNSPLRYVDPTGLIWETKTEIVDNVRNVYYRWVWQDDPEEGWEKVTDFWPDYVTANGTTVGLRLNPNGPMTSARYALAWSLYQVLGLLSPLPDDYSKNGYEFTANRTERHEWDFSHGGIDMMPNQAFDIGLTLAGLGEANGARSITFYRGTTAYDAMEVVGNQAINAERLAARQAGGATLDFGEGLYLTRSKSTAEFFASIQGAYGRQGGPAVLEMQISRFRFGQLQQSFGAIDRASISGMAGQTQTFIPPRGIDFFNKYATFKF